MRVMLPWQSFTETGRMRRGRDAIGCFGFHSNTPAYTYRIPLYDLGQFPDRSVVQ